MKGLRDPQTAGDALVTGCAQRRPPGYGPRKWLEDLENKVNIRTQAYEKRKKR